MTADKQPHPILVVGTGSIGQRHAQLLAERRDVDLWLCDIHEPCLREALEQAPGARAFTDYEVALAAAPEAVFVCTQHALHRPMSIAAFEAGCHVFCEKPLAETTADAEDIVAAATAANRHLQVGYVMRFHPIVGRLRQMIDDGDIGTLVGGRALVGTYFTLMASRRRFQASPKNALILDYTHQLDLVSLFFGDAERVAAEMATLGDLELMQSPNVLAMMLRYPSGALVGIHLDYVQYPDHASLEFFGDRNSAVYNIGTGELRVFGHGDDRHHVEFVTVPRNDQYRDQIENFIGVLGERNLPACTGADGIAVLRIVEAALTSAQELRTVEIEK